MDPSAFSFCIAELLLHTKEGNRQGFESSFSNTHLKVSDLSYLFYIYAKLISPSNAEVGVPSSINLHFCGALLSENDVN